MGDLLSLGVAFVRDIPLFLRDVIDMKLLAWYVNVLRIYVFVSDQR